MKKRIVLSVLTFPLALLCAIFGAVLAYVIVKRLESHPPGEPEPFPQARAYAPCVAALTGTA